MTDAIKYNPIIFSDAMVKAIIDGRKTQTRREVKLPKWKAKGGGLMQWNIEEAIPDRSRFLTTKGNEYLHIPYRHPEDSNIPWDECGHMRHYAPWETGDRLWIKESWGYFGGDEYVYQRDKGSVGYRATHLDFDPIPDGKWRKSATMPRWASRITLEITEVRVQRLQAIMGDDCEEEGILYDPDEPEIGPCGADYDLNLIEKFMRLWESIKGKGSWEANPWVWAISFKRVDEKYGA